MSDQPIKTTAGIAALMTLRDLFKQQANDVFQPVDEEMKLLKHKHHDALIRKNQLLKKAQEIQELITLEMQMQHDEAEKLNAAYEVKGYHDMKDQSDGD